MMPEDPAPRVQGMDSEHKQNVNNGPSAVAEGKEKSRIHVTSKKHIPMTKT